MDAYDIHMPGFACGATGRSGDGNPADRGREPVVTPPIEVSGAEAEAQPEAVLAGMGGKVEGRSLGQIAWMRLRRDKVAISGGVLVLLLILMAIFAPLLSSWFGHPPSEFHQDLIDPNLQRPVHGPWHSGVSANFPLGIEPTNGRDIFSRIVYGARISLLIAFLATLLSVILGSTLGIIAGYFGGWVDTVIARA